MQKQTGTIQVKRTFPEMLKGGVICDVVNPEQARIAEEAGACAVMALERVPADIRAHGGVARMSDPATDSVPRNPSCSNPKPHPEFQRNDSRICSHPWMYTSDEIFRVSDDRFWRLV